MKTYPVKEDRSWTIAVTRDRRIEKEGLKDYIKKKREMFLVQVIKLNYFIKRLNDFNNINI